MSRWEHHERPQLLSERARQLGREAVVTAVITVMLVLLAASPMWIGGV